MEEGKKKRTEWVREGRTEGGRERRREEKREMGRHGLRCHLKVQTRVLTNTKHGLVSPERGVAEWIIHDAMQSASCLVEEATDA